MSAAVALPPRERDRLVKVLGQLAEAPRINGKQRRILLDLCEGAGIGREVS